MEKQEHILFPFCCIECSDFVNDLFLDFNTKSKTQNPLIVLNENFKQYKRLENVTLLKIVEKERKLITGTDKVNDPYNEKKYSLIAILMFIFLVQLSFGNNEFKNKEHGLLKVLKANSLELNHPSNTFGAEKIMDIINRLNGYILNLQNIND